jgi:hypothetical protein
MRVAAFDIHDDRSDMTDMGHASRVMAIVMVHELAQVPDREVRV